MTRNNPSLRLKYHSRLEAALIFLTITFLVILPKGGIKIGGIPITWGYALLFGTGAFLVLVNLSQGINVARKRWLVIFAALPFQVYLIMLIVANGFVSVGFTISMIINVIALPWLLVVMYGNYFDDFDPRFMLNLIRHGIFIVAIYGIFLFFYRAITGSWLEIPFLTVNFGDIGMLDAKYNMRFGFLPKLISTYNNGNIFGVCMIMMLPLFDQLERSKWKSAVVKLALVLSLSRTVWIGLFVYEFIIRLYLDRITPKMIIRYLTLLVSLIGAVLFIVYVVLGGGTSFLFDTSLGGRAAQLGALDNFSLLSQTPFLSVAEIVYLSILERMGLAGLILFLIMVGTPILLTIPTRGALRKCFLSGVLLYLLVSFSDGAIMYIPVMAFFWFMISMMIGSNKYLDRKEIPDVSTDTGEAAI